MIAFRKLVSQARRMCLAIAGGASLSVSFFGYARAQPLAEAPSAQSISISVSVAPRVRLQNISTRSMRVVPAPTKPALCYKSSNPSLTVRVYTYPIQPRTLDEPGAASRDSIGSCDSSEGFLAHVEDRPDRQGRVAIIASE